tara:strand:+ start:160 stop:339 length:180 start_codon:yes stop_codon:yes gene_type:complete
MSDEDKKEDTELTEEEKKAMYTDEDIMFFTRGMLKQIILFGTKLAELEQRILTMEQKNE